MQDHPSFVVPSFFELVASCTTSVGHPCEKQFLCQVQFYAGGSHKIIKLN